MPYAKINSKWIKELNIGMTITKVLEENTGDNPHDTEFCSYFLDMTLKHRPKGWQKIAANYISDRELITRIYMPQLNNK